MLTLSPMNARDEGVPHVLDFSRILAVSETVQSVAAVSASPDTITVGEGSIVGGERPGCAVQFTLGSGASGQSYVVSVSIESSAGVKLTRTVIVPVVG